MFSTIGIIIDVAIVLALVIFGIIGFKRGFLKSIISLFSWVVCIAVAILTAKYVAGWLNGIFDFAGWFGGHISNALTGTNEFFVKSINSFASAEEIITTANGLEINGLLKTLVKVVFSNTSVDMTSDQPVASIMGSSLGHIIMLIITAILIFIILKIAVALLSKLFDNIAKTKILGGLNKILGLVFGVLKAGIVIIVFNGLLVGLSLIPAVNNTITPIIQDNTKVERFVYNKTDEFVEKYIIEGNVIQTWISSLWEAR